ncbi:MAG: SRPBCC domain-containing protein [Acidobacteria bacterium]|nr:SRPBCC domain-containing protein [Acidobacteriota bacterium]
MTRVVEAPRKLVWAAWTHPDHPPHWMLGPEGWAMPVCEIDLRPGGAWPYVWRRSDGTEMEMRGVYERFDSGGIMAPRDCWSFQLPRQP